MLPLDQFCPPVSDDHVLEVAPDRRSVIFSANGATWSYAFSENSKTKKLVDIEARKIRYLDDDTVIIITKNNEAKIVTLSLQPLVVDSYTGVMDVHTRPGSCAWFILEDGSSVRVDRDGVEQERIENAWVVVEPGCRVIGSFSRGVFSFYPNYSIERPWTDYVTSRITPEGKAIEVTFRSHDWVIETLQIGNDGKDNPIVNKVLNVSVPGSLVDPYLTVDRRSGVPAFVYGFDTNLFEPKTISLHKTPGVTVITRRLSGSSRIRADVDILDKAGALLTIESLISDKRSSLSLPSSRSANGMLDKLLPVPANTPMWAAPGYVLTGDVVAADGQRISYILHGFSPQGNPKQPTVVVVGDDSTLSGRFSPTASVILRAGFNLLVVKPAVRYATQGFGSVSNISVNDASYDIDDVISHLRKAGKLTKTFMIGIGHSADTAIVLASIVDSEIDGVIAIDAPLNTILLEQSKPVGCNIVAINSDSRDSHTWDKFESIVSRNSGRRVKKAGSVFGWTGKTYGSIKRFSYDDPQVHGDSIIRDIFSFISREAGSIQ